MMTSSTQRLQRIFKQLAPEQQETLLAFAEFLQSRLVEKPMPKVKHLPRPPNESVVAAIKRLAQSYPMLDKAKMLNETSRLMSEHILRGRDSVEVIDELETVFLRHYEEFLNEKTT
ncbi:hypothetical protein THIOM_001902 [Candidatus Thiomargarita nelsonii]|uniref:Crp/Fnr family transcriptional regulator n=1 Tax=Candidatus Thiomargarita nelsonii TaxID=1003181 RepID=A0A176S2M5_9GAMM|nr:hypothetical protein THIOM_001902 [Candidatus Thiomargarita nelsonii]